MKPITERPESELILLFKWINYQKSNIPELSLIFNIPRGFKAGLPNVCFPYPRKDYHGLYILLAYNERPLSYSQKFWIGELSKYGYLVQVAKDRFEAKNFIMTYLKKSDRL